MCLVSPLWCLVACCCTVYKTCSVTLIFLLNWRNCFRGACSVLYVEKWKKPVGRPGWPPLCRRACSLKFRCPGLSLSPLLWVSVVGVWVPTKCVACALILWSLGWADTCARAEHWDWKEASVALRQIVGLFTGFPHYLVSGVFPLSSGNSLLYVFWNTC